MCCLLVGACTPSSGSVTLRSTASGQISAEQDRSRTMAFARIEDAALDWVAAADPRLAARLGTGASDAVLKRMGTDAILVEDASTGIRGRSLDLFSFRARSRALDEAAKTVASFHDELPEVGPVGGLIARPRLERELLQRLIDEERARAVEEARLGGASGELVRAIVSTWTLPATPQEVPERDLWVSKHLLEIRESLRSSGPPTGPLDLDVALYPLERILAPLEYPRGSAAIAQGANGSRRGHAGGPEARACRANCPHRCLRISARSSTRGTPCASREGRGGWHELAASLPPEGTADRRAIEGRARELLIVERSCPAAIDSKVRSMAPPPERGAILWGSFACSPTKQPR